MIKFKSLALYASSLAVFSCAHRLPAPPGANSANLRMTEHQVLEGDTLLKVGKQYAVAPSSIQRMNRLGSQEELKPGQLIYIPVSEKAPESADLRGRGKGVESLYGFADDEDAGHSATELTSQYHMLEWPLEDGKIESNFGPRGRRKHKGVDIFPTTNQAITSAQDGVVEFAGKKRGYGNVVIINHKTFKTLYAHCSKLWVKQGQAVRMGEKIAHVGATGNAHGAHLHFEYQSMKNVAMDPMPYLDRDFAH